MGFQAFSFLSQDFIEQVQMKVLSYVFSSTSSAPKALRTRFFQSLRK